MRFSHTLIVTLAAGGATAQEGCERWPADKWPWKDGRKVPRIEYFGYTSRIIAELNYARSDITELVRNADVKLNLAQQMKVNITLRTYIETVSAATTLAGMLADLFITDAEHGRPDPIVFVGEKGAVE